MPTVVFNSHAIPPHKREAVEKLALSYFDRPVKVAWGERPSRHLILRFPAFGKLHYHEIESDLPVRGSYRAFLLDLTAELE